MQILPKVKHKVIVMTEPILLKAHGKHAQAVLFCEKHKQLLSAGQDAMVHIWSLPDFERSASFEGHDNSVNTLSLNPDENRLASGSTDQTVKIWSFPEGELLETLEKQVNAVFNSDGKSLATIGSNGRVSIWNTTSYSDPEVLPAMGKRTFGLAFSPNGTWLAIGGTGSINRYNVEEGILEPTILAHQHAVPSLRFSADGTRLIATGAEGTLSVWNVENWEEIARVNLPAKGVLQTALSSDGNLIYVSMDGQIAVIHLGEAKQVRTIEVPIKGVYGLALSPDNSMLANAGADGNVRVWKL
jgi:WD40 repeat protein